MDSVSFLVDCFFWRSKGGDIYIYIHIRLSHFDALLYLAIPLLFTSATWPVLYIFDFAAGMAGFLSGIVYRFWCLALFQYSLIWQFLATVHQECG